MSKKRRDKEIDGTTRLGKLKIQLHFAQACFKGPSDFMSKCFTANIESTAENDLGIFRKCLIGGHCLIGGCLAAGFHCIVEKK